MATIREGMTVRSSDGEKLGKVISIGPEMFTIEKGFLFKRDYVASNDEVRSITEDELWLTASRQELESRMEGVATAVPSEGIAASSERGAASPAEPFADGGPGPVRASAAEAGAGRDRMTLSEEELIAEKHRQQVGEVRVRKEVVTEQRQVSVPVTREEVRVEHVPVSPGEARPDERAFQPAEIDVPVHEEEVEIHKRPVVREEVRVSASPVQEQETIQADARREEARVESEGNVRRRTDDEDPDKRR
jgi:uncharacterized protein (TIGR02271 family)